MEASEKEREVRLCVLNLKQTMDAMGWEGTEVERIGNAHYRVTSRHGGGPEQRVVVLWDDEGDMPLVEKR